MFRFFWLGYVQKLCQYAHSSRDKHLNLTMSLALETVCGKLNLRLIDDPATRLVASKIIELAQRGVRDAPTLTAMTLKELKHNTKVMNEDRSQYRLYAEECQKLAARVPRPEDKRSLATSPMSGEAIC